MNNDKVKILLIDDFITSRRVIKNHLNSIGYKKIIEATNGIDALKILQEAEIDLIISDWDMPELDGLELFAKLRKEKSRLSKIPFVMVSSLPQTKIATAVAAGITHYIAKPCTPELLLKKIKKALHPAEANSNMNCWEYMNCGREFGGENIEELGICPAWPSNGRKCAYTVGTLCGGEIQGTFSMKIETCQKCNFFHSENHLKR